MARSIGTQPASSGSTYFEKPIASLSDRPSSLIPTFLYCERVGITTTRMLDRLTLTSHKDRSEG